MPSSKPRTFRRTARAGTKKAALAKKALPFFAPMLAHSWDFDKHDCSDGEWLLSEKLDGMRALWLGDRFVSRTGKPICAPSFFTAGLPNDVALDGELFAGRGKFPQTVSVARRHAAGEGWRDLHFSVFDAPTAAGDFRRRLATAKTRLAGGRAPHASVLAHKRCQSNAQLRTELARIEKLGGEGVMMRKAGSAYTRGRSHDLLKVKSFKDDEALVTGHINGKGKNKGRLGALMCRLRTGHRFKIGGGFSDAERESPPPVNSIVTFSYFEMTASGVPRFPIFLRVRGDADPADFRRA